MNYIYVLTKIEDGGEIVETRAYASRDDAVSYAMEELFGEDWEIQLDDDEWENQSELLSAMDAFEGEYAYVDKDKVYWYLTRTEVE